jgi:hypothetical protein
MRVFHIAELHDKKGFSLNVESNPKEQPASGEIIIPSANPEIPRNFREVEISLTFLHETATGHVPEEATQHHSILFI